VLQILYIIVLYYGIFFISIVADFPGLNVN